MTAVWSSTPPHPMHRPRTPRVSAVPAADAAMAVVPAVRAAAVIAAEPVPTTATAMAAVAVPAAAAAVHPGAPVLPACRSAPMHPVMPRMPHRWHPSAPSGWMILPISALARSSCNFAELFLKSGSPENLRIFRRPFSRKKGFYPKLTPSWFRVGQPLRYTVPVKSHSSQNLEKLPVFCRNLSLKWQL